MDKKVTEQEKTYLDNTLKEIEKIKDKDSKKYKQNLNDIQYLKKFFAENFYDIKKEDDELAGLNIQIENLEQQNVNLEKEISRLQKEKIHTLEDLISKQTVNKNQINIILAWVSFKTLKMKIWSMTGEQMFALFTMTTKPEKLPILVLMEKYPAICP